MSVWDWFQLAMWLAVMVLYAHASWKCADQLLDWIEKRDKPGSHDNFDDRSNG